jgi:acyl-CoA hydrolase
MSDANNGGNVHGGVIMHLCDEVAGIAAVRHGGTRVVTAAMDRMNFSHPVFVGQLVTVKATVNAAWNSSMEVGVRVESENVRTGEVIHTSTAYLTMVALDEEGNPTEVPPIEAVTSDERRREREAQLRRDNRLAERQKIEEERARS